MKARLAILSVFALVLLTFAPPAARADLGGVTSYWWTTNDVITPVLATTTNNSSYTSTASTPTLVPQNQPLLVTVSAAARTGAGAGTETATVYWNVSVDGTHYTTTYPVSASVTLNGTTIATGAAVINSTNYLTGARWMRLDKFGSTHTNIVDLIGVGVGVSR